MLQNCLGFVLTGKAIAAISREKKRKQVRLGWVEELRMQCQTFQVFWHLIFFSLKLQNTGRNEAVLSIAYFFRCPWP